MAWNLGINLLREHDMMAHFVDLLEVLTQMRESKHSNQPAMPNFLQAVTLLFRRQRLGTSKLRMASRQ
jgi:hypothetical protein